MRFVDYKCTDCGNICEIVLRGNGTENIKCESCGSSNMARVFAPVGFKSSSGSSDYSLDSCASGSCSTSRSCSGSCSSCSGCS